MNNIMAYSDGNFKGSRGSRFGINKIQPVRLCTNLVTKYPR